MTAGIARFIWEMFRRRNHRPTAGHPHPAQLGTLVHIEIELWGGPRDGERLPLDQFTVCGIEAVGPGSDRITQMARTALVTGCVPVADLPKVTRWSGTYTVPEGGGMLRIVPAAKAGR